MDVESFQQQLIGMREQFGLPLDEAEGTAYRADGFAGATFRFTDVAASEFGADGEEAINQGPDGSWEVFFVVDDRGVLPDLQSLGLPAGGAEIRWQVRFPYEVVSHNGELVDPGTVLWEPDLGGEAVLVFRARTNATPVSEAGDEGLSIGWAIAGGAVALAVIGAGGWYLTRRQRRDRASKVEEDAPGTPPTGPTPTATVTPVDAPADRPFDHSAN